MRTSESTVAIQKALKGFQAAVGNIPKTATNPHFNSKFAPLDEIVSVINQKGPEFGLSHVQSVGATVGAVVVTTRLMHESGEWIESDPLEMPLEKATAQGAGSSVTYARRYQLPGMYGLATEEDDDGNAATGSAHQPIVSPSAKQFTGDLEAAKAFVVPFGKHKDKTLREIAHEDDDYLHWLAEKCDKPDVSQAARMVERAWKEAQEASDA